MHGSCGSIVPGRPMKIVRRYWWNGALFVAGLYLVCAWSWAQIDPPAALPDSAPLSDFSALRARRHVEQISRAARPIGSAANQSAREYILRELKSLGIPASVEQMTAFRQDSAIGYSGARVKNIVARISGYGNSKAVLLSCHYDSVVEGPGASDDGAAVGALLETARALRQTVPLRNDVIFLFTDGEEPVMMGADACVTQSKWIQDVGLVMNFEARGTCGPSLMFENVPARWRARAGVCARGTVSEGGFFFSRHLRTDACGHRLHPFQVAGCPRFELCLYRQFPFLSHFGGQPCADGRSQPPASRLIRTCARSAFW